MDAVALASVVSTGITAVATILVTAATKRGDRKHMTVLEFDRRAWETKSQALIAVIGRCHAIRAHAIASAPDDTTQAGIGQRTWEILELGARLQSEASLVAYAHNSVITRLDELYAILNRSYQQCFYEIVEVDIHKKDKEDAIEKGQFGAAATIYDSQKAAHAKLGAAANLDFEDIAERAQLVVTAARRDLRGGVPKDRIRQ